MCGIAGIFNYNPSGEQSPEAIVKNMLSLISHRGPDESGIYLNKNVAIGNVRLSIIDLSSGQQPLADESSNFWIVYNGEVFNYDELREMLKRKGIRFKTNCDTEVVVQMYAVYGKECLNYFNGQFAFCIYDKAKKELFLARDRVGIRPLFYWSKNKEFAFCSEIKGLFAVKRIERKLSQESLAQTFTFWSPITPQSSFQDILELQPGHCMLVNENGVKIEKYWSVDFSKKSGSAILNLEDSVQELERLLHDSVKIRLKADVPVGAYLSGGLDSTVTTAIIKKINPEILNTFSIGFKDKNFDESDYQNEASAFLNTNHKSFSCTAEDIAENFEQTIWHTECPVLRTSPTPMYLLSKKVRENNIKVVITGEGADEYLGGYNIFKEAKIRNFWAKEPNSTCRPSLLSKLYPYMPIINGASGMALKMFFGYKLTETANPYYSHLLRWNNTGRIRTFFSADFSDALPEISPENLIGKSLPEDFHNWTELSKAQYLESTIFMSGYLLSSQGDRMGMGNSVEGRYPFLDYRLIEFCNQLPDKFKLNGLNEKFILKKLGKGKIPESIRTRQKQPYRAPINETITSGSEFFADILSERTINSFGIFDPDKIKSLLSKQAQKQSLSEIDQMALIGILSTQLLYKKFIQDPITPDNQLLKNYRLIDETDAR